MSEATVVESRLNKLEQDNRRLKLALGSLLLLLAAMPLVGAAMPEQIPDLIQAREFRVIDENGTKRAEMTVKGLSYFDENGTPRACFARNCADPALNAIDRGKQKRTVADLRSLGTAVETYSIDNNIYPVATTMAALEALVEPVYIRTDPTEDGWGRTFTVSCAIGEYALCSGGKDGGSCLNDAGGATNDFNDSITFVNGQFVQWPEGQQQ